MEKIEKCNFRGAEFFYVDSPSWQFIRRFNNPSSSLIFVVQGNVYMEIGGVRYAARDNEFLYMPGGIDSRGYRASDKPTGFYHVCFATEDALDLPNHFSINNTSDIHSLLTAINSISKNKEYEKKFKDSLFHSLIYEIYYQYSYGNKNDFSDVLPVVDRMKRYIRDSAHRNLTRQDVAHHFGFSVAHTQRLFASETHIPLKTYINNERIKQMKEMLMARNISTKSLADQFGFDNVDALNKYFKYHTGKTIKEFQSKFLL